MADPLINSRFLQKLPLAQGVEMWYYINVQDKLYVIAKEWVKPTLSFCEDDPAISEC